MFNIGYAYYWFGNSSGVMKTIRASEQETFLNTSLESLRKIVRFICLPAEILTRYAPDTKQQCYSLDCDVRPAAFPTELLTVLTGHTGFFLVYLKTSIN
jgi:hypothetical protein